MSRFIIIGAGLAGLLAAGILRTEATHVVESQSALPNNHSAVLRFRSSVVGDALNIPFRKVKVMKAVEGGLNPVAASLAYSLKTNGTAQLRSSVTATGELVDRFIAPDDLVKKMAERITAKIEYGHSLVAPALDDPFWRGSSIISTIPMPALMAILGYENRPEFGYVPGYNLNVKLTNVDAFATVYLPDFVREENRISLTGDRLTIEVALPAHLGVDVSKRAAELAGHRWSCEEMVFYAMKVLGLQSGRVEVDWDTLSVKPAQYAKILPVDESIRRHFIVWASQHYNIYSLGRFATWRPGLLLDDVVNDVRVIQKLIAGASNYDQRLKGADNAS